MHVRPILEYAVKAWAPTLREISISLKVSNIEQQDFLCQIFNLQQCLYYII